MAPDQSAGSTSLDLVLTPRGHLVLVGAEGTQPLGRDVADRLGDTFASGSGDGLLQLGAGEISTPLPPADATGTKPAAVAPRQPKRPARPTTAPAPTSPAVTAPPAAAPPRVRTKKMTAAQRKAASERMRRYWEERRRR